MPPWFRKLGEGRHALSETSRACWIASAAPASPRPRSSASSGKAAHGVVHPHAAVRLDALPIEL